MFDQESKWFLASIIFSFFFSTGAPRCMAPFSAYRIDIILDLDNAAYVSEVVYERCGNFE